MLATVRLVLLLHHAAVLILEDLRIHIAIAVGSFQLIVLDQAMLDGTLDLPWFACVLSGHNDASDAVDFGNVVTLLFIAGQQRVTELCDIIIVRLELVPRFDQLRSVLVADLQLGLVNPGRLPCWALASGLLATDISQTPLTMLLQELQIALATLLVVQPIALPMARQHRLPNPLARMTICSGPVGVGQPHRRELRRVCISGN